MNAQRYLLILLSALVLFTGCDYTLVEPDTIPPSPPRGLETFTGDNMVEISWLPNPERDVAGYRIYVNTTRVGTYEYIGATGETYFEDLDARNGITYYYTVTAYDREGNESVPSDELAYDVPRPEGRDVVLLNYRTHPDNAGYDFSTYSTGPFDDKYTDFFFEYYNGAYYLNVWEDSDIQDMGYTKSLYGVREAPLNGWSPTKDVRAIAGHTYIVWTWDNHFAKIRIAESTPARVVFDWAYQLQEGNPMLKRHVPADRGSLRSGSGFRGRE